MDPSIKLYLGKYRKYLYEAKDLIIIFGDFEPVQVSRERYNERHNIAPLHDEAEPPLRRVLSACALVAHSLAERESFGWTLTLPGSPMGFFCAVEPEGMICGRARPAPPERAAVYVNRKQAQGPITESHYTPTSDDPVKAIQGYFEASLQIPTRIELDDALNGVLIQALPNGDPEAFFQASPEDFIAQARALRDAGTLKPMAELLVFYECRCDENMVLDLITSLPKNRRKELWGDDGQLEIECPRCGREYILHKKDTLH